MKMRFPNRFDRVRGMRSIPEAEKRKEVHDGSVETQYISVKVFGRQGVQTLVREEA